MQDHPAPPDPENDALRQALQRDAERVPQAQFNAGLHYATMRRVRALTERPTRPGMKLAWLWAIPGAAVLAFAAIQFHPPRLTSNEITQSPPKPKSGPAQLPGSEWSYQMAAAQGDETFASTLDHDAQQLLPATSPLFSIANFN